MSQQREHAPTGASGPAEIDAYVTTGSSPGHRPPLRVHVVGLGSVGRALVERLRHPGLRLAGLTDRSGSILTSSNSEARRVAAGKAEGDTLAEQSGGLAIPLPEVLLRSDPDVVVDATHTDLDRTGWHDLIEQNVLRRGRTLVLAAKDALCRRGGPWVAEYGVRAVRFNAVLAGTGAALADDLHRIRDHLSEFTFAGNATTTAIIDTIEQGGSLDDGIERARRLGLLEPDPELDLRGVDAVTKLAIVSGLTTGSPVDPDTIPCPDIRDLSPSLVRRRASEGYTTRLIGRFRPGSPPSLSYEALPLGHPLAVPHDAVSYLYGTVGGEVLRHCGGGLGPDATADAAIEDLARSFEARTFPATSHAGGAR